MISVQIQRIDLVLKEITPLIQANYAEVGHFQEFHLCVDMDRYRKCEAAGAFRMFTLRDDGVLIGYAGFWLTFAMHNSYQRRASHDCLYVKPEHRRADVVKAFITEVDRELKAMGMDLVSQIVPLTNDFGPFLEAMGYEAVATTYARKLH